MIRYKVSRRALRAAIDAEDPNWRGDARALTKKSLAAGHVADADAIWGRIKRVYARIQHFKCVYCERQMPHAADAGGGVSVGRGAVEYDVEHFRPKHGVKPWPTAEMLALGAHAYASEVRQGAPEGYLRLAFDPTNYGVSCKTCNSGHKGDRFPIAGRPSRKLRTRAKVDVREKPLLMLPLGDDAVDPETVVGWLGPLPTVKGASDYERLRARVCIDFFALDTRTELLRDRALRILVLWGRLESPGCTEADVGWLVADDAPMAACSRAFVALYNHDRLLAQTIASACNQYVSSAEPTLAKTFQSFLKPGASTG